MKLIEAVSKRIKQILKERDLNQYKLSKLTGVPQSTITTILHCDTKTVQLSTIYEICAGLEIEFTEFFDEVYFKILNIED